MGFAASHCSQWGNQAEPGLSLLLWGTGQARKERQL